MPDQTTEPSSILDRLRQLPDPVKWILGLATVLLIFASGSALGRGRVPFFVALFILLALVLGGYLLWRWRVNRIKNREIVDALGEHTRKPPPVVIGEQARKEVERFRQKFAEGIQEYRKRGKNLYSLPWYVIIGETGSGKTQAIRHSDIGFPEGLHDEFRGVGGTINMDWFFTEQAVILDTAGRIVSQQVETGASDEWREFLTLLQKHRPRVPFNGLLLVIPADSLQKDPKDEARRKARLLLRRLEMIQNNLDVRFPVFVVITKCDLISGFREFFDDINDAELQHQIFGWSNPAPLDSPYDPKSVQKHLAAVVERLNRRRMGLLSQTEPESLRRRRLGLVRAAEPAPPNARRIDEVDVLYAFPNQFASLAEPLQIYLETLFTAGTWSLKPLFLRGIYFTSSMREGMALDRELVQHGVPLQALPEGRAFEREKAYFLTDLFREKIFREKGLVTPATNTRWLIRKSQAALYAAGSLALVVWLVIAWIGRHGLNNSVEGQSKDWEEAAKKAGWREIPWAGYQTQWLWRPIINLDSLAYVGDDPKMGVPGYTLAAFQSRLYEHAKTPIEVDWTFKPVAWMLQPDQGRDKAQRIVFEAGVMKPLVFAARQKLLITNSPSGAEDRRKLSDAVLALLLLESKPRTDLDGTEALNVISGLLRYLGSGQNNRLFETMNWTYSKGDGKGKWPPAHLSAGRTLTGNSFVAHGLQVLFDDLTNRLDITSTLAACDHLLNCLRKVNAAEDRLSKAIKLSEKHDGPYNDYTSAVARLSTALVMGRDGVLKSSPNSLDDAYKRLAKDCHEEYDNTFISIERATNQAPIFGQVAEWISRQRSSLPQAVTPFRSDLGRLDADFLAPGNDKRPLYMARFDKFRAFVELYEKIDFPLVKTNGSVQEMGAEDVKTLCRQMNGLKSDFPATNNSSVDVLKPLTDRLSPYFPLAQALLVENQLAEVTFKLVKSDEQQFDVGGTRLIGVPLANGTEKLHYTDSKTGDVHLATISVADRFPLKMFKQKGDLSRSLDTANPWSAIRLLHEHGDGNPGLGGTNWIVRLPFDRGALGWPRTNGWVLLRLEFSRPLPSLDRWPTKK